LPLWHTHPVHTGKKMRTGSHPHPVLIFKSKRESDPILIPKSGNSSVRYRQRPKLQVNYSNQQYHLLIANKHQKLLTYFLFEGLIEDLEEWKQTDAEFVNGCWNDNRMTYSSGCKFFCNVNRTGMPSGSHFFTSVNWIGVKGWRLIWSLHF